MMKGKLMLMTVMGRNPSASYYGELAGVRALITGLSPTCGAKAEGLNVRWKTGTLSFLDAGSRGAGRRARVSKT